MRATEDESKGDERALEDKRTTEDERATEDKKARRVCRKVRTREDDKAGG
jgi:hypothetical protein